MQNMKYKFQDFLEHVYLTVTNFFAYKAFTSNQNKRARKPFDRYFQINLVPRH